MAESTLESPLPVATPKKEHDSSLIRVAKYMFVRLITMTFTVILGLYLTILIANMGGYVDRIRRGEIRDFVHQVFTTEGNAVLKRNENYPDLADKWARFSEPKVGVVDLSGEGTVTAGQEATFDVFVTFKDEPYPADEIESVKYLVFNANNEVVATGEAEAAGDGQYTIVLGPDVTSGLEAGANRLEVAVASKLVSIPSFANFEFVTVQ